MLPLYQYPATYYEASIVYFGAEVGNFVILNQQAHSRTHTFPCFVTCTRSLIIGVKLFYQELVDDALKKGARQIGARGILKQADGNSGNFMQPVILADVDSSMRIWREEVFGPVSACYSNLLFKLAIQTLIDCLLLCLPTS